MRRVRRLLLLLFCLLVAGRSGPARAARVVLEPERTEVRVGETVPLRLTVVDGDVADPPELPEVDGLVTTYQGVQQSTVVVNFRVTRTLTFTYGLTAHRPGTFRFPSVPVEVEGRTLRTRPFALTVRPAEEGDATARATLGTERAWVGQTLVYHVVFRSAERVVDLRWNPPDLDGLVPEQTAEEASRQRRVVRDERLYLVWTFDRALVASSAGEWEVPPATFTAQVADGSGRGRGGLGAMFPRTRTLAFTTEPLPLVVRPLPEAGRGPAWTGLVGRFGVTAELNAERVAVGDSATLTVRVEGDGTLGGFALPAYPSDLQGVAFYDDSPEIRSEVARGRFHTVGTYRRAVVPEAPGTLRLPALPLQVFDPVDGSYVDLQVPSFSLEVVPGAGAPTVRAFPREARGAGVDVLAEDILPIRPQPSLHPRVLRSALPAMAAVAALPWACGLVAAAGAALRRRWARRDPRAEFRRRLGRLEAADAGELERLLREGCSLVLGRPAAGLVRGDLAALPDGVREDALAAWDALGRARYGGGRIEGGERAALEAVLRRLPEVVR